MHVVTASAFSALQNHILLCSIIGRAGASPPSRSAGHPAMKLFLVSAGPRNTRKRKAGLITSGKTGTTGVLQANLAYSVLRLTMRTTPVPYLVNAQSAGTVRFVVTGGKG